MTLFKRLGDFFCAYQRRHDWGEVMAPGGVIFMMTIPAPTPLTQRVSLGCTHYLTRRARRLGLLGPRVFGRRLT